MMEIIEWKWVAARRNEKTPKAITCPYCGVKAQVLPHTRIVDVSTGTIKYTIHQCLECAMPVIIGLDGQVIPQTQSLPFADIRFLPPDIERLYNECRRCYLNGCYNAVIMVSRSLLMHIAVNMGDAAGKKFTQYIDYLEENGYIGKKNKAWVDKIRTIGNQYVHSMAEATGEDAKKVIVFLGQLLGNLYEMPQLAL